MGITYTSSVKKKSLYPEYFETFIFDNVRNFIYYLYMKIITTNYKSIETKFYNGSRELVTLPEWEPAIFCVD